MKTSEKLNQAFSYFKSSYSCKMGGTQTVSLPNGKEKYFDDREYYSGRGAKYNSSIRHDEKGLIKVSRKEYSDFLKMLKERDLRKKQAIILRAENAKKYGELKSQGLYGIKNEEWGNFIELSEEESSGKFFDAERLAKTLDISVADCELLNSEGKTYVYAKNGSGQTINLYHSDLSCNDLNISVEIDNGDQYGEMLKNREEWINAPYADLVGQTTNQNHFVC